MEICKFCEFYMWFVDEFHLIWCCCTYTVNFWSINVRCQGKTKTQQLSLRKLFIFKEMYMYAMFLHKQDFDCSIYTWQCGALKTKQLLCTHTAKFGISLCLRELWKMLCFKFCWFLFWRILVGVHIPPNL